ncbi:DUF2242 domain-containing protein [Pseudomonas vancouverensis]|uniref:DUF2242 domain-containing protein n=1 Tax=Pseudomonas vancouverensis TaxID=95300 RepID=A0A1H2NZG2_PSEVA|nr:DUF2242 domain-containing protein [Pseudomonas vancouverensis]KAB0496576.1 DUF2242 domain-containing protein [Pseudomonas vancouverensis]TDB64716.1 DUF2242 domain-containing protein [Pseudomonas vancouverensis]SDV10485.1 hypothetical protein SAMN05216558_3252 [Pseudomonas vancouverensis]
MSKSFPMRVAVLAAVLAVAAGCSSNKGAIYEHEKFDDSGTFSRNYPVSDAQSCEAARRALLSQGYIITSNDPKLISGHKSFQQTGENHMEISFSVVCTDDGSEKHHATVFANALQDRYALKKTNNSASLGVGVLGSVSMPIGSSDDSMVKVASETVTSAKFYDRFFGLIEMFLPAEAKKAAHITEKPKTDLGVPETKAAPAALAPTPAAAPAAESIPAAPVLAPVPVEATPVASETVVPAPAPAPSATPVDNAQPAAPEEVITPPSNPADMPPPGEPIPAMPASGQ